MTKETMTVHKALCELKLLDKRIESTIANGTYCVANKHSNEKINGVSVDDFKKVMQGCYDKAMDLINRREAIKRAVTKSNAVTMVDINGSEYTVAEAIEMKNHGIYFKKRMMEVLQKQYTKAVKEITKVNNELETRADNYITSLFGEKESKTSKTEIENLRESFIKSSTYELVDPIGVLEKINTLEEEINAFISEVDSALSCSNAITTISIEY